MASLDDGMRVGADGAIESAGAVGDAGPTSGATGVLDAGAGGGTTATANATDAMGDTAAGDTALTSIFDIKSISDNDSSSNGDTSISFHGAGGADIVGAIGTSTTLTAMVATTAAGTALATGTSIHTQNTYGNQ